MRKKCFFGFLLFLLAATAILFGKKYVLIHNLNSIWKETMSAAQGSFVQTSLWQFGDDRSENGRVVEFKKRESVFYFRESWYDAPPAAGAEPIQTREVSDDGNELIMRKKGDPIEVKMPVEEPLSLEFLLSGLWEELALQKIKEIKKEGAGMNTKYTVIFSSRYCHAKNSRAGDVSSVLESKQIIVWVAPDRRIRALDYITEGVIKTDDGTEPIRQETHLEFDSLVLSLRSGEKIHILCL